MAVDILIVAGEASADLHGAHLVQALKRLCPDARFFGVGGKKLSSLGVEVCVPAERLNVVGGADWFDKIVDVLKAYRELKKEVARRQPAIAILLDLPDFNLRLARYLKRLGIPVAYYISPQVWAWRRYRTRTIRRTVDRMLVVFPFEKAFYEKQQIQTEFVGHPLLDHIVPRTVYRPQGEVVSAPRVALLPGSRTSELRNHASVLNGLATLLRAQYPGIEIRIPVASTLDEKVLREFFPDPRLQIVSGDSRQTIVWADIAAVASGTATLETAVLGTPFCLFYKMSQSTVWVIRYLIRYRRFFGMPNLLHGREVVREFLHEQATATGLFRECRQMIENEAYRRQITVEVSACRTLLGNPGASERAAHIIFKMLPSRPPFEASFVLAPA